MEQKPETTQETSKKVDKEAIKAVKDDKYKQVKSKEIIRK